MTDNKDNLESEPLPGRTCKARTQRERRAEAIRLSEKGHIVNPLGTPKKRGSRLTPSRARPVTETGNVTIPQLWATYVDLFGKAFGLPDMLPNVMADTKENVSRYFDDLRQRFLDATGFLPENRDLYEYLIWFHDPKRLRGLMNANKRTGNAGYVHPTQLLGIVHVKRFHDEVVRQRGVGSDFVSARVEGHKKLTNFVMKAYDKMRNTRENELVYCLCNYGYVIFAEFLHDYKGYDASACRERIIEMMSKLIRSSTDKKKATEFLHYAWKATEANEQCFRSAVWTDWKDACKDILDVAIQVAKEHP